MRPSPGEAPRTVRRSDLLLSPGLVVSLAVLVVNDWVLKPAFHNALTGKLSDFAGVAALGLFARAVAPRRPVAAAVFAGMAFAFWKSPASQPLIDGWNALGGHVLHRVVDWTDLAALIVLPWIWSYAPRRAVLPNPLRRALSSALAAACVMAFAATSVPVADLELRNEYPLALSADSVLVRVYDLRLEAYLPGVPPRPLGARDADTVTFAFFPDTTRSYSTFEVDAEIRRDGPDGSLLRLLSASGAGATPREDEVIRWAEAVLLPTLRAAGPALPPEQRVIAGTRGDQRYAPRLRGPFALYEPRDRVTVSIRAAAHVALVEATPQGSWHLIYPAGPADEELLPAGTHVLRTSCAGDGAPALIPPGSPVPACGLARRATLADAEAAAGIERPTCMFPSKPGSLEPSYLLVIAADAPLRREVLDAELRNRCLMPPVPVPATPEWIDRMFTRMGVSHWEMTEVTLRR